MIQQTDRARSLVLVIGAGLLLSFLVLRTGAAQATSSGYQGAIDGPPTPVVESYATLIGQQTSPNRQPLDPKVGLNGGACAFETITEALAAAVSGDTIFISQGTYPKRLDQIHVDLIQALRIGPLRDKDRILSAWIRSTWI